MNVESPVTASLNTKKVGSINPRKIELSYSKILPQIDPSKYFANLKTIDIYECLDTGYRFYYPLNLGGDDEYYAKLGMLEWYYKPWKIEHEMAVKHINKKDKVLEVGAAKGAFLKRIKQDYDAEVVGLELNPKAEEYSKESQVTIYNKTIQDFSKEHAGEFDVVCSFQVLEHISEVKSFLEAKIKCLKKGGKLIISVPNNDTFISENRLHSRILNQPPHHLGLWGEKALKAIASHFDLKYLGNDLEKLQPAQYETYVMHVFYKVLRSDFLVKVCWKLRITKLFKPLILRNKEQVKGHSINAYYTKN